MPADDLVHAADAWAKSDRKNTAEILGILIALEERKVSEDKGYPSLFQFCTERLKFSEAMAFWRIRTARAAKSYPIIVPMIEVGHLNITTVTILSPYLDQKNHEELLGRASGKSRKEVEAIIAGLQPSGPRRDVVVKCGPAVIAKAQWPEPAATAPTADAASGPSAEQRALDVVEAIDAERRRLHFDVGPDTAQLLERAREILRHKFPFASLEDIVREALNVLLDEKDLDRDTPGRRKGRPARARTARGGYPCGCAGRSGGATRGAACSWATGAGRAGSGRGWSSTTWCPSPRAGARTTPETCVCCAARTTARPRTGPGGRPEGA